MTIECRYTMVAPASAANNTLVAERAGSELASRLNRCGELLGSGGEEGVSQEFHDAAPRQRLLVLLRAASAPSRQQVVGENAQPGDDFDGVLARLAGANVVLCERNICGPVVSVFDPPVQAHKGQLLR